MSVTERMKQMHGEAIDNGKQLVKWMVHPNDINKIGQRPLFEGSTVKGHQYLDVPLHEDVNQTEGEPKLITL